MSKPVLDKRALPSTRAARISACGRPLIAWTLSGERHCTAYACRDRYCANCGDRYASRAFAKISEAMDSTETESVYMATVTRVAPGPADVDGDALSGALLRQALRRERDQWQTITSALRWDDYRIGRGRDHETRIKPPDSSNLASCAGCETWSYDCDQCSLLIGTEYEPAAGYWPAADGDRTYLWALEITTGANGDRWHVHRHIITHNRVTAERILCAAYQHRDRWQATRRVGYRVDLREIPAADAAGYVAGYLSGRQTTKGGWESAVADLSAETQAVYVRETMGVRRYDAAGDWRPLGMSPEPSEDPWVVVGDHTAVYPVQEYYRRGVLLSNRRKRNDFNELPCNCTGDESAPCTDCEQNACKPRPLSWLDDVSLPVSALRQCYDDDQPAWRITRPPPDHDFLPAERIVVDEHDEMRRFLHRHSVCYRGLAPSFASDFSVDRCEPVAY